MENRYIEGIKEALQDSDQAAAVQKIKEYLEKENNTPLNIAITGECGAGKSTFVNAFRGIDNDDEERAAPTGCVETTTEVTAYPHPNYPKVTLWDLPGIGTPRFSAAEYLKVIRFEKYDFFIIISADRFKENDVKLAKEIQKMGRKFYFVRSKIDSDLKNEKRSKKNKFDDEKTLRQIREYCRKGLEEQGFPSPQVFLVSSFELHLYDFSLLHETLEKELPDHKRDALLLTMPNISMEIIDKKKKAFKAKIKYWAMLSAAGAAVPVPALSTAVDAALIVGVVTNYVVGFGLDIPSLKRLSKTSGVSFDDLLTQILSPLAATKVTVDLILKLLVQSVTTAALLAAEEGARFIPILGIPAAMSLSFISTYSGLRFFLNMLADDTQRVFKRALSSKTSV